MPWLWVVDPPSETISVRAAVEGGWRILREAVGDETVAFEPFAAIELPLGRLWQPIRDGEP